MTADRGQWNGLVSERWLKENRFCRRGGDDEKETCIFVNWADVTDFLRVEIKKMRSGRQERNVYPSLLGTFLDTIEFGDNAIKDKFISISKEMLICLLQREATQRDVERERRQRMEAEARVREATAEAERARSRVHHLQRELAR